MQRLRTCHVDCAIAPGASLGLLNGARCVAKTRGLRHGLGLVLGSTRVLCFIFCACFALGSALAAEPTSHVAVVWNRPPLAQKPYAELPLGAIEPQGWLKNQLERLAQLPVTAQQIVANMEVPW